jgi:hypothetical protein
MESNPMTTLVEEGDNSQLSSQNQAQGVKRRRSKRQYIHSHTYESKEQAFNRIMKYVDEPSSAKTVRLNEKRKAGQPRTALPALEKKLFHSLLEADEEDLRIDEMIAIELARANETILSLNFSKRPQPEPNFVQQ